MDRGGYGAGKVSRRVRLTIEGIAAEQALDIEVSRRAYTPEEEKQYIALCKGKLRKAVLGKNEDARHVDSSLRLPERLSGNPTVIRWSQDDYSVLEPDGTIDRSRVSSTGSRVTLTASLTCGSSEDELEIPVTLYPPKLKDGAAYLDEAAALIRKADEADPSSDSVTLPRRIGGRKAVWKEEGRREGYLFLVLGIVGALFVFAAGKDRARQAGQERARMIEEDYPKVLNLFSLLLRAGLTPGHIWAVIVSGYHADSEEGTVEAGRPVYEAMAEGLRRMQAGVSREEVYLEFGHGLQDVRCAQFGQLLAANLRHGTADLAEQLAALARTAFEERKLSTKARGEEAQTKLLLPMIMLLGVVLTAVMVPAFMSMQLQ